MTAYRLCRLVIIVLSVLAWATTVYAQTNGGKHAVGGFVGSQLYDRSNAFDNIGANFGIDANLGGRYQYNLTEHWAVEGSVLFSPGNTKLLEAALPTPPTSELPIDDEDPLGDFEDDPAGTAEAAPGAFRTRNVGVNAWYYNANAIYRFTPLQSITPYATAGIGGVSLDVSSGNTEQSVAFNFGGGVTVPIGSRLATRIDVRDHVYTMDNLGARTRQALAVPASFSSTIHDVSVNFGMTWTF